MKSVAIDTIGGRIRNLRKQAGLTQMQVGDKAGVTTATISLMEKNVHNPTLALLQKIATALDVDVAVLLGYEAATELTLNGYQNAAARTIREDMLDLEIESHALHGMVSEIGEFHGIYQKVYQGHAAKDEHLKKELGDLLWFIAEYCTARGWDLGEIAQMNIDKLKARYPEGFEADKSLHRKAGDI
jgi:transcriptional regulator with XRE-family HTH domain